MGYSWFRLEEAPREAAAPWTFAERLLADRPRMVERQTIRAVPGGRSFASSRGDTPLHTDSQRYDGGPARIQVMACVVQAGSGGEILLVDTQALLAEMAVRDAELHGSLFEVPRRMRFYFGDVTGPTVAGRCFTHPPRPAPDDSLGVRLQAWVDAAKPIVVRPDAGDVLVVDNHRMLHGRRAFEGTREFVRLLVWPASGADEAERRLLIVLEMLRGVSPGQLSARERLPEAELYGWRDQALAAARQALAEKVPKDA